MCQQHNPCMPACNLPHLLLFLSIPLCESRALSDWLQIVVGNPFFFFLSFSSILYILPFTSFFHLAFFFIHFPPSCCLCPLPWHPSLSLILLCGGFAVDSPRHEWSISRSPGGSSPYNSVQWAWIVSQSTQKNLSVNTVLLWAASLQWCVRIKRRRRRNFLNRSCWAGINMMPEV